MNEIIVPHPAAAMPDPLTFDVNGKTVNLRPVIPLKIGDWRKLGKKGITIQVLSDPNAIGAEEMFGLIFYVLQKANPEITEADADELTMPEMSELISAINSSEATTDVDHPT